MATRILLIEDNDDHVLFTRKILKKAEQDFELEVVPDASEGLEKLNTQDFDLVLCDYRLPGITAMDVLKEMKETGRTVPLIVITASGSERIAVDLMREGAYDYIVKDVSYEDALPAVIQRSIDRYNVKRAKEIAEDALRKSEERYRLLAENITDVIWTLDLDFKWTYISPSMSYLRGYSAEESMGQKMEQVLTPASVKALSSAFDELALKQFNSKDALDVKMLELEFICKDGSTVRAEVKITALQDKKENKIIGVLGVARDITERKKSQEELEGAYHKLKKVQDQLIRSSKMVAIGQLAAGISHELNQPLTGIKGFSQAILMDLPQDSPIREDMIKIIEQSDRMDKIIKNVRFFSRQSEFKAEEFSIDKPIDYSLMLLTEQLRVHNIKLEKTLSENLPKIKGDLNQLQQVILNLVTNARDALDSVTEAGHVKKLIIKTALSSDAKGIELTIQDTGIGISKEVLDQIFNPFFTTKSPEGGIGLGLSIVYGIIDNHGGKIDVDSEVGKGTTFKIILPIS